MLKVKTIPDIKITKTIKLISQNKPSCILHPYTSCNGEHNNSDYENDDHSEYILKIVENNEGLDNDINIGKKLEKFSQFMSPILEKSPIRLTKIDTYKESALIADLKTSEIDNFYSVKIRNLGNKDYDGTMSSYIHKLISNKYSTPALIKIILSCYYDSMHAVDLLCKEEILHFNIRNTNIMYNLNQHTIVLSDFSRAFDVNLINTEISNIINKEDNKDVVINYEFSGGFMNTLMRIFHDDNASNSGYNHIDIIILSYYIRYYVKDNKDRTEYANFSVIIKEEIIKELIENYMTVLKNKLSDNNNSYKTIQKYFDVDNADILFSSYWTLNIKNHIGKHWNQLFKYLFIRKTYKKWDKYSVYFAFVDLCINENLIEEISFQLN